jgi:uncharacterized membrane protein (UPF0182 family)
MFSVKNMVQKQIVKQLDKLEKFRDDKKAFAMTELIMGVVALFIVILLVSAIIPTSITAVVATNTTTWGAGAISMWGSLPVIIVLVIFLIVLAIAIAVIKKFE